MKSEDRKMKEIEMTKMVEEMDLRNLTPEVDMTDLVIATPDINRPAPVSYTHLTLPTILRV